MNTIKIKSLSLINFKGVRKLEITEFGKETKIFGANATGKTTIFDAFTWMLFGKDSSDRTAFEIKTLDKDNNVIPNIEHEVSAIIEANGEIIEVKRILREKWVKQRGTLESTFQGNETHFFWNEVPVLSGEFSKKVASLLDEKIFKLITNPLAFNSLKWQDQRTALIELTGGLTDQEIAGDNADFKKLLEKLTNKTLDEYKKQVSASIKKAKDELKMIPTRIDEVDRSKPDTLPFESIKKELEIEKKVLIEIEGQISDKLKAQQAILDKRSEVQNRIYTLKNEINAIKHDATTTAKAKLRVSSSEIDTAKTVLSNKQDELKSAQATLETLKTQLQNKKDALVKLNNDKEDLKEQFKKINSNEFKMDESETCCPTCTQELPKETIDQKLDALRTNFNAKKRRDLEEINNTGGNINKTIDSTNQEIIVLEGRIDKGEKLISGISNEIETLEANLHDVEAKTTEVKSEDQLVFEILDNSSEYAATNDKLKELTESLKIEEGVDTEALKGKSKICKTKIAELQKDLHNEEQINKAEARIKELMKEESTLSHQIADVEKEQFAIENFIKEKIDRLEAMINTKFRLVSFKMFETQINGGQSETCKALINGVPFSDANTASKINAGIDIINTLCNHYKVSAPIFIDNRESVVSLIPSESQIINLIVSEADKSLRIENVKSKKLELA